MIQIGNDKIKDIYVGSDKIKEVYYGSELVWGGEVEPIEDGYWVHKDTGVITYFVASGSFSSPSWKNNCSEVKIPDGVTGLGDSCFTYCSNLTSIILPKSVTSLGINCFRICTSLTSITLPESLNSLGGSCFQGSSLTSITLPESVTSLGNDCFRDCSSLTLATVLPATPPTIGFRTFRDVHTSFNIKVHPPYVNAYKAATNWTAYAAIISGI